MWQLGYFCRRRLYFDDGCATQVDYAGKVPIYYDDMCFAGKWRKLDHVVTDGEIWVKFPVVHTESIKNIYYVYYNHIGFLKHILLIIKNRLFKREVKDA